MNTNVENKGQLPDNVIALPTSLEDGNFFRLWVEFLKPLHHLTDREMDVITAFLKKSGVFVDGNINPKFIPNLKMDKGNLQMLLYFTF